MDAQTPASMSSEDGPRALVTDRELEILRGDADVTEKYYNVVKTRVRNRIERLEAELPVLEATDTPRGSLASELRDVVCDE